MFGDFYEYYETLTSLPPTNLGNCKRCMFKSGCGNKNKREEKHCNRYRPEIKLNKRRKK